MAYGTRRFNSIPVRVQIFLLKSDNETYNSRSQYCLESPENDCDRLAEILTWKIILNFHSLEESFKTIFLGFYDKNF